MRGDDGAYAILYAITIVLVLAFAGIVVDINTARADRRLNRSAADSAALAAATQLRSDSPNALAACQKATAYLNDSIRALTLNPAAVCAPFTAYADNAWTCPAAAVPFAPVVAGDYRIVMTWPVVEGSPLLTNPDVRPGNITQNSDADFDGTTGDRCQRFAVTVFMEREFIFGPVVNGPGGTSTGASSVGRAAPEGEGGEAAVALILLERHGCNVLELPNTGPTVIVQGNGDKPGGIQADSTGSGSDGSCGSNSKIFHVQQNDERKIVAEPAESPAGTTGLRAPGVIGSVALTGVAGAVPARVYSGDPGFRVRAETDPAAMVPLAQQVPTPRSLVSRSVVDSRYRTRVKELITEAQGRWTLTAAEAVALGFAVIDNCNLNNPVPDPRPLVFVNCPSGVITVGQYTFSASGSTVVFNRPVGVGGGPDNFLAITDARKVFIRGGLSASRGVRINSGSADGAVTCGARQIAAPARTAALVLNGPLEAGANAEFRLCATTILFAACPVPVIDGTAPLTNACSDIVDAQGGTFDWSAPNAVSVAPMVADFQKLEDLALWGEASDGNRLNGGVQMTLSGIFFLPNANPFSLGGNGTQTVRNAQMIVRRLRVSGNSVFSFKPDPEDVILIPFFGGVSLIR